MARPITKRDDIVETALRLFARQGIHATTIRQIADEAAVGEGTMYRYYRSKDELALDIFSKNYRRFAHELQARQAAHERTIDKLRAMAEMFYELFDRDRPLFTFMLLSQHNLLPRLDSSMPVPTDMLIKLLRRGMARGEVQKTDATVLAAQTMGVVLQMATFHIYGRLKQPLKSYTEQTVEALRRLIEP